MTEQDNPTILAEGVYGRFKDVFEPLLAEVGIERSALSDPNTLIPLVKHAQLMELAASRTGDDCLGLHVGLGVQPTDVGAVGFALVNSPTLKAALANFARYLASYARGCFFELSTEGEFVYYDFGYTVPELGILDRRQEAECTLAMVMNIVRSISGDHWCPERVGFEHPKPKSTAEHKRIFGAPVEFGQPINRLVFKRDYLEKPVKSAQPRLYSVIEDHLQQVVANLNHEEDMVNRVSNLIARELSNGVPTIDWIADQLAMTKRTLQRRLTEKGVGFTEIVDDVRRNLAIQYVEKSDISLTEVAFLLGYSHLSAFCRSFKRWTATTPQKVRSQRAEAATA